MKKPNGVDLLALLINLYADQCGVEVAYEFEEGSAEQSTKTKLSA